MISRGWGERVRGGNKTLVVVKCSFLRKPVICHEATWQKHILPAHPELGRLCVPGPAAIAAVVSDPTVITDNGVRGGRRLAYYSRAPRPYDRFLLRVAVAVKRTHVAVLTSHVLPSVPDKEVIRWRKP